MKIAAYKGKSWISKLIRWFTRGPYSHVALVIDGLHVIEAWHNPGYVRMISNLSDGHTPGTTVDIYDVDVPEHKVPLIREFCQAQMGKRYDFRAITKFLSRRKGDNPQKWFCSELAFAAFQHAGIDLLQGVEAYEVSPSMLARSPLLRFVKTEVTQ